MRCLVGEGPGHSFPDANEQLSGNKAGPSASAPAKNIGFVSNYQSELVLGRQGDQRHPGRHPRRHGIVRGDDAAIDQRAGRRVLRVRPLVLGSARADTAKPALHARGELVRLCPQRVVARSSAERTIYNSLQDAGCTWATYDFDSNEVLNFSQVSSETAQLQALRQGLRGRREVGEAAELLVHRAEVLQQAISRPTRSTHRRTPATATTSSPTSTTRSGANPDVWMKSALIVTYDEHGGFYDHVVPPSKGIPNPDGINSPPPGDTASWVPKFAFDRLGMRVPAVIASPWVAKGQVDSTAYQHTSALATLKSLFALPKFLTARDAHARPFDGLFQKASKARTDTPATLPRVPLPKITVPKTDPAHPANQPLDETQKGNPAWRARPDGPVASRRTDARHAAEDTRRGIRPHPKALPAALRPQVAPDEDASRRGYVDQEVLHHARILVRQDVAVVHRFAGPLLEVHADGHHTPRRNPDRVEKRPRRVVRHLRIRRIGLVGQRQRLEVIDVDVEWMALGSAMVLAERFPGSRFPWCLTPSPAAPPLRRRSCC